eukprot:GHVU01086249.1.p2 GENE.GHVU01086249.1~~GHVU01086249.1.p2  ORF type:complete len:114 (-),score=14.23 GHVU01086249.1:291-632(-)
MFPFPHFPTHFVVPPPDPFFSLSIYIFLPSLSLPSPLFNIFILPPSPLRMPPCGPRGPTLPVSSSWLHPPAPIVNHVAASWFPPRHLLSSFHECVASLFPSFSAIHLSTSDTS